MSETPSIRDLNKLGLFTNRVSEIQFETMRRYPFIYFNGVKECIMDYNIAQLKGGESFIGYNLTLDQENDHLPKRFEALQSAIRSLFWSEILLKLSINGKEYKNE